MIVQDLDKSSPTAQSLLLVFSKRRKKSWMKFTVWLRPPAIYWRRFTAASFSMALYYKLATLTLKLQPVRERRDDIPVLADWFARSYADVLRISEPTSSAEASSRL